MPESVSIGHGRPRATLRTAVIRSLQAGAALSFAALVFLILWAALTGLGDAAGAQVAGGVVWGLAICWAADVVFLVVVLALAHLATAESAADGVSDNQTVEQRSLSSPTD